jgi:hypothetical protein
MALGIVTSSLLAGYKPGSIDENEFFSILRDRSEVLTEETKTPMNQDWIFNQGYYLENNYKELAFLRKTISYLQSENLNAEIQANLNKILETLPNIFIDNVISNDNVYCSSYGTVLIDFEEKNNIFSLEIGTSSIGYFSEINSVTSDFCEEIFIDNDDNFERSVRKLNNDFLAFYDRIV